MNQDMKSYLSMELRTLRLFIFKWKHEKYIWDFLEPDLFSISPCVSNNKEQKTKYIIETTNNTFYLRNVICLTVCVYNRMGTMVEDSSTCTPLKYINRCLVNLKLSCLLRNYIGWKFHC